MTLTRNILKHAAVYSGANALGKMVGFIMLPFYAHIFNTEGFGIISMVDGSVGLLSILFGAASNNAMLRVFHSEDSDTASRRTVISTSLWLTWGTSILMAAIPIMFSLPLSEVLFASPDHQWVLVLALLTFVVNMGNSGAENYLIIYQRSVTYSLIGLFRMVLGISLNIYLVIILKIGVIGIFLSSFLTAAVSGAIVHWIAIANNGLAYNPKTGHKLLSTWIPLMPGEFFSYVGRHAEIFFVRYLVSLESVGILGMAYKFPPLLGYFISQPFLRAWRTKNFEIAKEKDSPVVMGKMFTNMLFLMTAAALLLAVTIDELLMLLTPASFWGAARIARIGIVTAIIVAAHDYFIFGLLYANQPWRVSVIKISMAALKVALSGIFISLSGLDGAAMSALIVQALTLAWIFKASQSHYRVVVEYGRVASILGIAIAMAWMIEYAQSTGHIIGVELISASMTGLVQIAEHSRLASWGDGRIITALNTNITILAQLLIEGSLASVFVLGIFVLRPELRRSLIRRTFTGISAISRRKNR